MEQIDYTKILPTQPPEGMTEFLHKNGYLKKEYIVYRVSYEKEENGTNSKVVKCKCTACGETSINRYVASHACSHSYASVPFGFIHPVNQEAVISRDSTVCPICGKNVEAIHVREIYNDSRTMECCYPIVIYNIDGKLAIVEWEAATILYKNGTRQLRYLPSEAAIVEKRKIVRCNGLRRYYYSYINLGGWEQRVKYADEIGAKEKSLIFPFEPEVLNGTYAENSKLDIYIRDCDTPIPVAYLKLWQIHKNVENLVMQGVSELVTEQMKRSYHCYAGNYRRIIAKNVDGFNWDERKPNLMVGTNISKEEFRYIANNKLTCKQVDIYRKFKGFIKLDDAVAAAKAGERDITRIIKRGENVQKVLRYIEKQKQKYKTHAERIDTGILLDYWDMAEELGENLGQVAYPKNLGSAHDRCTARKKWKENEKLRELFIERAEQLKPYCYSSDGIEIHPAQSENEMIIEGKILHHCVAGYAKRHAQGQTAIFFIRHSDQPEVPYFTLELDEKNLKVRQNRGLRNCARTEEVIAFEEQWLKYIKEVKAYNERNNRSKVS